MGRCCQGPIREILVEAAARPERTAARAMRLLLRYGQIVCGISQARRIEKCRFGESVGDA